MLQRKFDKIVRDYFPNALDTKDTSIRFMGRMQDEYKIDISKVLMATSLCSDDINAPSTTFFNVLFGPFIMGGLGGLPFAGKTGMTAFAHHIPDDGAALIFYGPHIGVTLEGDVGRMYRPRQEQPGNSCGALMLALSRFRENPDYEPVITEDDYQQKRLEASLLPYKEEILEARNQEVAITEATFKVIDEQIHKYLKSTAKEFKVNKVALLGGIIINTDYGLDDYFAVRTFEVMDMKALAS